MIQWNKIKEQRFGVTPIPRLLPCTMSNSSKRSGALGKVRPAQSLLAITTAEFDLGPGLVSECPIKWPIKWMYFNVIEVHTHMCSELLLGCSPHNRHSPARQLSPHTHIPRNTIHLRPRPGAPAPLRSILCSVVVLWGEDPYYTIII
jgi:hypothetical protein